MSNTKQTHTPVKWENELQALKNALISLKLDGFEVWVNHNGFRTKTKTFCLRDNTGTSITGSWTYDRLNHFIMGYGKALQTAAPSTPVNDKQEQTETVEGFTPGEWRVVPGINSKTLNPLVQAKSTNSFFTVCEVRRQYPFNNELAEANARLIASAPNLYRDNAQLKEQVKQIREALTGIIGQITDDYQTAWSKLEDGLTDEDMNALQSEINKANEALNQSK